MPEDTVTSIGPGAAPAGAVALIDVGDRIIKEVAGTPPNETPVTVLRLAPVIVTLFPPASGPELGVKEVIEGWGAGLYVYGTPVPVPDGPVTVMVTVPLPGGAIAVIDVSLVTLKLRAGVVPKLTCVANVKPLPVNATEFPPAAGPVLGTALVTTGRGMTRL